MSHALPRDAASPHDEYRSRFHGEIFDFHTHFSVGTQDAALTAMEAAGLSGLVNLVGTWPPQPFKEWKDGWSGPNAVGGMLLFHAPNLDGLGTPGFEERLHADVRQAFRLGASGIKIWKQLGLWLTDPDGKRVTVDDPRLAPIWRGAAEFERPVGIHIADPEEFFEPLNPANPRYAELLERPDWSFARPGFPTLEELHDEFESLVNTHPETDFIALHFGCFIPFSRLHRMMGQYQNLWLETSARVMDMSNDREWAEALIRDFADRVLFGSDYARMPDWINQPLPDEYPNVTSAFFARQFAFFETDLREIGNPFPFQSGATVRGLALPQDVLERMYVRNARRLLKLPDVGELDPRAEVG